MSNNAAIQHLEERVEALTNAHNSIEEQTVSLERLRGTVERAEADLARDKKALVEINAALSILKAGEA